MAGEDAGKAFAVKALMPLFHCDPSHDPSTLQDPDPQGSKGHTWLKTTVHDAARFLATTVWNGYESFPGLPQGAPLAANAACTRMEGYLDVLALLTPLLQL